MIEKIQITIPLALTRAEIARVNEKIRDDEALTLAHELHDLIKTLVQTRPTSSARLARPRFPRVTLLNEDAHLPYGDAIAFEVADVVDAAAPLRSRVPARLDWDEACNTGVWLMKLLTDLGDDSLYDRYLRLHCRISEPGVHAAREIVKAAFTRPPTTHAETDTRTAFSVKPASVPVRLRRGFRLSVRRKAASVRQVQSGPRSVQVARFWRRLR